MTLEAAEAAYEVELKFPLGDPERILSQLEALGAKKDSPLEQRDVYFAHPSRDFAQTDEALRIRSFGGAHWMTYKGPVVDARTKTRREIEIPFGRTKADGDRLTEMLALLGFRPVRTVEKTRTPYRLEWEDRWLDLALDEIAELGTFLEIEALANGTNRDAVRDSILRFAERLKLENAERRSYLRLLLEKDAR